MVRGGQPAVERETESSKLSIPQEGGDLVERCQQVTMQRNNQNPSRGACSSWDGPMFQREFQSRSTGEHWDRASSFRGSLRSFLSASAMVRRVR